MTIALPATVTFDEAGAVLRTIEGAVHDADGTLRIDASALSALDTGVLALLLQARRLAAARGLGFELLGAPAHLLALARLYGVESLLGLPAAASLAAGAATTA
jgi:phospholipid transport system transporter-binding protein